MRIGCLQFAPQVGDVDNNLNRADAVLNRMDPKDMESLDLLVLPEMAFSGYNFKSRDQIFPFLEPPGSGISSLWARTTALKYDCIVAVGYPERARKQPYGEDLYNSLIVVNGDGETIANYRKSFLYYTDETWAKEGGGFYRGEIANLGKVAMGICMDINPYKFETPWSAFEFGCHILSVKANLVIVSMAWLTREEAGTFTQLPQEPDMETLTYWVQRLEPIIRAEGEEEIIVVFANRCGVEGDAVYAGTSAVLGVQNGEVSVYGLLGRGAKEVLIVNTETPPFAKLVSRPENPRDADEELGVSDGQSDSGYGTGHHQPGPSVPKSPDQIMPSSQRNNSTTRSSESDTQEYQRDMDNSSDKFTTPAYDGARDAHNPRGPVSPPHNRISSKVKSSQDGYSHQSQRHAKEGNTSRRTASPREDSSPKPSSGFQRAASTRDGYSPRPSPVEVVVPRPPSRRNQFSPGLKLPRPMYSPGFASNAWGNHPSTPYPRDDHEPSPEDWYKAASRPQNVSSHRTVAPPKTAPIKAAPIKVKDWDEEGLGLRDLASPSFPEPTPLSMRPKLAISTGPETLPPMPTRQPPRGVQPGNFFSSRDLCTPPETPFDDEPQPFIQQHWPPPSAFTYTPEEPEWPDSVKGSEGVGQLVGRRPSLGNVYAPPRTVPPRPSSRTQEVKASDLHTSRPQHRTHQDIPPRHTSKSRNSDRARGPVPDRRPTPPQPRNKPSESSSRSVAPPVSRTAAPARLAVPTIQPSVRDDASSFPWNSITIAASPSVFKTEFSPSETFPRQPSPPKTRHQTSSRNADSNSRLKRSKSISGPGLALHQDPTNYLPSPALPVHKAYQDMIYSAVEPAVSVDSMWAAAVESQ